MNDPNGDRPNIPYGILQPNEGMGLLPWYRVSDRLRGSYVYWITTSGSDGRPHAVPVWGVWLDEVLYFSNGSTTRTGRNLAANRRISVHLESGEDVVIIEGAAENVTEAATLDRVTEAYMAKYLWKERMPEWYALRAAAAYAWLCPSAGGTESIYAGSATRWKFER